MIQIPDIAKELPWLVSMKSKFETVQAQNAFPQSLVLTGNAGLGLDQLAVWMGARLLNATTAEHPDLMMLELEEKSTQIKIDQIRQVSTFLSMTAFSGPYKISIIQHADSMNINAQNALLKTLEEPTENAIIILVASAMSRLLPTILSRCQIWTVEPDEQAVSHFLKTRYPDYNLQMLKRLCNLGPLHLPDLDVLMTIINGLSEGVSVVVLSEQLKDQPLAMVLDLCYRLLQDVQLIGLSLEPVNFQPYFSRLSRIQLSPQCAAVKIQKIEQIKKALQQGIHLNTQLMLEDVLI